MADLWDIDPLAIEVTNEINEAQNNAQEKPSVKWEHEDLAQVRIRVIRGHTDAVSTCQFCADDSKVLTASHDATIRLWDLQTGECINTYAGHTRYVSAASTNNQVDRFVSSSWDKSINLWDVETGSILWSGTHGGAVTCCDISSDGRLVTSGSDLDYSVKVWDAATGEIIADIPDQHTSTVTRCMFNNNGDRIITTSMDQTTKFWDIKSQTTTIKLKGHTNVISGCSITPDERKLATVGWDKAIQIWDVSTGGYRSQGPGSIEKAHEGSISSCCFSPDGTLLVTGGYDNTVALWDIENMVQKLRLQGHENWVEGVQISKDMKWLLSCSRDHTVRLWNIEESDKIPLVLENRKSIGLRIQKCKTCGKPFSISQSEQQSNNFCVFCRLQTPDNNTPELES